MISEPFRSKKTGFEKGVLIQLLPKEKMFDKKSKDFDQSAYDEAVYASDTFIHPTKIAIPISFIKLNETFTPWFTFPF